MRAGGVIEIRIRAVVIRADGTKEDRGVIATVRPNGIAGNR